MLLLKMARRKEQGLLMLYGCILMQGIDSSHVKADGKTFEIDKGLYFDSEWLLPSRFINCRCTKPFHN